MHLYNPGYGNGEIQGSHQIAHTSLYYKYQLMGSLHIADGRSRTQIAYYHKKKKKFQETSFQRALKNHQ